MAYSTISKPSLHFNTKLFTGTGSSNAITGVGFQPDWVWIKDRQDSHNHNLFDAVRGVTKRIHSDTTDAETTNAESLKSFDSDGFTLGTQTNVNQSGHTNVAWNWKAGGGQGSSNTDGSINTTYTSVNTTAGFSISKYTGTGSNATIGHGLGVAPKVIILKNTATTNNWCVGHGSLGFTKHLALNSTDAVGTSSVRFQDTAPTSTVFSVGTGGEVNGSGNSIIAYCFAEKTGYSKFGSYTGNGNADGTFVYCGFKPAWIMIKRSSSSGDDWYIFDSARDTDNTVDKFLYPNGSASEGTISPSLDFLSNGFKWRKASAFSPVNADGATYIFMAFGQSIVGSNNVPAVAR